MGIRSNLVVLGVIALVAASCGGGSDDAESSGNVPTSVASPAESTAAPTETPATTQSPAATGAGSSDESVEADEPVQADESMATVTIDGVVYEFGATGPAATCNADFFGGFTAVLYTADSAGSFAITLWNEGAGDGQQVTQASMKVEVDGETLDLDADPEMSWPAAALGSSFVDQFSYEGNRASGTIHFINSEVAYNADLAPLDAIVAEFEVLCV